MKQIITHVSKIHHNSLSCPCSQQLRGHAIFLNCIQFKILRYFNYYIFQRKTIWVPAYSHRFCRLGLHRVRVVNKIKKNPKTGLAC